MGDSAQAPGGDLRSAGMSAVAEQRLDDAIAAFQALVTREPEAADGWINMASAELSMGRAEDASEHFARGVGLLKQASLKDGEALSATLLGFGTAEESLGRIASAARAFLEAYSVRPSGPRPLRALAFLLARAGHLPPADRVALAYCKAAVSVLTEKALIPEVRRFQNSLGLASRLDGGDLLRAAREAYAARFEKVSGTLPRGVRLEAALHRAAADGRPVLLTPDPRRPFAATRIDAIEPRTGERWMIDETPTFAVPHGCEEAAFAQFPIPWAAEEPFRVAVSTRTAWDYLGLRIRFAGGCNRERLLAAERLLGSWYTQGFDGVFGTAERGFFHFISPPTVIGDDDLLYQIDCGLADLRAIAALLSSLETLHREHSLDAVVLGDAHLPMKEKDAASVEEELRSRGILRR